MTNSYFIVWADPLLLNINPPDCLNIFPLPKKPVFQQAYFALAEVNHFLHIEQKIIQVVTNSTSNTVTCNNRR
jgi:hypothetical protein